MYLQTAVSAKIRNGNEPNYTKSIIEVRFNFAGYHIGMSSYWRCLKKLSLIVGIATIFSEKSAIAQITPDNTLTNNSSIINQGTNQIIQGGTQAGTNLYHSFEKFSVSTGSTAYFNNALDIQNIITRVTGSSASNIDGVLRSNGGANLYLVNPNGIIFGANASLDMGGSFIASTANSINFADGTKFSAIAPQTTSLLTVSTPIGLQFGASPAPIRNQSQARPNNAVGIFNQPVGLQVQSGKTLALVGGEITLAGGNLTAVSGQIELGAVGGDSIVSLIPTNQGLMLGYGNVNNFEDIRLIQRNGNNSVISSVIDTSGVNGSGRIQLQGKNILISGRSRILGITLGAQTGKNLVLNAADAIEISGRNTLLITQTRGNGNGGDLNITAKRLVVSDAAQVATSTLANGGGGNLNVNASESVEMNGNRIRTTALVASTFGVGKAGNISINTQTLRIQNGVTITVESVGEQTETQFRPAIGNAGNLRINASKSVELIGNNLSDTILPTQLSGTTVNRGDGGKIDIITGQLIVRDRAQVNVSSKIVELPNNVIYLGNPLDLGKAGELNIAANSIILANQGKLISETDLGQGGNIVLTINDILLMRNGSQISTNAGKIQANGNGGNITINAANGFIVSVLLENNDITANAFAGSGGKIQITANGILGIQPRSREDFARLVGNDNPNKLDPQQFLTSDITAISQIDPSFNGVVTINTPDVDSSRGIIQLPQEPQEAELSQVCKDNFALNQSQFIISGRGGLPHNPREVLRNNSVDVDWISLEGISDQPQNRQSNRANNRKRFDDSNRSTPIIEAQGWLLDNRGEVFLIDSPSIATPHRTAMIPPSCFVSYLH